MSTPEHPLRSARLAAGIDQDGLAERSGVSQGTISRIEGGTIPTAANALRLARALNTTVEALFGHTVADVAEAPGAPDAPTVAA